tara:strand:- start:252 stop:584 length:333 start_codon:yes stop_codon:yes gene_type:complete
VNSLINDQKIIQKYKFIDLFAGIGGFRLGLQRNFSECSFSCEWDKYAAETYFANFGEKPFGDINELNIDSLEYFHILTAWEYVKGEYSRKFYLERDLDYEELITSFEGLD